MKPLARLLAILAVIKLAIPAPAQIGVGLSITEVAIRSAHGLVPQPPSGAIANTILTTGRGSSTYFGTGAVAGVSDYTGLTKALVATPNNIDITGVFNGRVSDVADSFTNSGNAHYVSTAEKAGTINMELFGSSSDMAAGGEATVISSAQTAVATLPDPTRFYYVPKYDISDASSAANIVRSNIERRMERLYPAALIDWPWLMRNLPALYANDTDAQALGILPPGYSNNDNLHMNPAGFAGTEAAIWEHVVRGQAGELPFIADGRVIFSRTSAAWTNGGTVADFPILDDLTGTTLSTTSTDFAFAQTPGNSKSIRVSRASATVFKNIYTLVPLTERKVVNGKLFSRTLNLRLSLGLPQPTAPAVNRWNGDGLSVLSSANSLQNSQTITDFTLVVGIRVSALLDGLNLPLITSGAFTLTKATSGILTLTIKQAGTATTAISIATNNVAPLGKLTSTSGMVYFFFEGSTASAGPTAVVYGNDTNVTGGTPTNLGADTSLGFWNTGSTIFWNTGKPDANVINFNATMVDKTINAATNHTMTVVGTAPTGLYPSMVVTGSGVTSSTIQNGLNDGTYSMSAANTIASSTAMVATMTNSMRPALGGYVDVVGPFLYPCKLGVANQSIRDKYKDGSGNPVDPGTTACTPILDLRGNAADMWRGAAGTDGGTAKNYGTGGDLQIREREYTAVVTQ
jgi:hypothetical protein